MNKKINPNKELETNKDKSQEWLLVHFKKKSDGSFQLILKGMYSPTILFGLICIVFTFYWDKIQTIISILQMLISK